MLQNSGPYGPNESPGNIGVPLNMSQCPSPMNIAHNLHNFSKIAQHPTQTQPEHYNLPDYPTYNNPSLSMNAPMNHFQNYPSLGFQPAFSAHNSTSIHDTSWQNSMLPMNLHTQSDQAPSLPYYALNDSKQPLSSTVDNEFKQPNLTPKILPISIPQVQKPFQKQESDDNYSLYNVNHDKFNCYSDFNQKTPDRPLLDNTRRKSLENTVRLIENILINTTKNQEKQRNKEMCQKIGKMCDDTYKSSQEISPRTNKVPKEKGALKQSLNKKKELQNQINLHKDSLEKDKPDNMENIKNDSVSQENKINETKTTTQKSQLEQLLSRGKKQQTESDAKKAKLDYEPPKTESKPIESGHIEMKVEPVEVEPDPDQIKKKSEQIEPISEQNRSDSEQIQPNFEHVHVEVKLEVEVDPTVAVASTIDVKVEQLYWTDTDYNDPFQRDLNAILRDDIRGDMIIDCENSVNEATAEIKNGTESNKVYECPHCNILLEHPKRFLIHTKWHSFGLTNEKRMEMVRERQIIRNLRKEARVVDRMNSKEVTGVVSGSKVYPCKDCDKVFSSKGSLKNHRQRFHPTRERQCRVCGERVLGWMALRVHLATHSDDAGFRCVHCNKSFKYAHCLTKHQDTHLEKTVSCELCPKKFGSVAQLKMHKKVHERAERGATFRCTYCGKGFYEAYNLGVHERTHRNERPYLCDICNTSYGTNSSLKRHIRVSHNSAKPYECPTCHRSFSTENIRDRHELRQHGDPEDFKFICHICDCRYLKQKDLQKHIYKVHTKGKRKKKDGSDSE